MSRLNRITSDPAVCHGQPTVLDDYPDLERDDLLAALEFGALAARGGRVVPLGAA